MPIKAFISYSHKDAEYLDKLHEHLAALRRQGLIDAWTDRDISAGGAIDEEVSNQIEAARLYILLVSASFINSQYCFEKEFQRALARYRDGKAIIVPIIIRECDWTIDDLRQFKALPRDGLAVNSRHWHSTDEAFVDVAKGLREVLETHRVVNAAAKRSSGRADDDFIPDSRHVSQEERDGLRKLVEQIVDRETAWAAGKPEAEISKRRGMWFGIIWKQFNEEFGTTEHGLRSLLSEQYDDARNWLLQYRASKDSKYKRVNPLKFRNSLTKTIYTVTGKLGWSKLQLYAFAAEKLDHPGTITSLDDLGNSQLELVRDRVRYEAKKRGIKASQGRARRNPVKTAMLPDKSSESLLPDTKSGDTPQSHEVEFTWFNSAAISQEMRSRAEASVMELLSRQIELGRGPCHQGTLQVQLNVDGPLLNDLVGNACCSCGVPWTIINGAADSSHMTCRKLSTKSKA